MKAAPPQSPLLIATLQLGLLVFMIYYILIGGQTAQGIYDHTWRSVTLWLTSSVIAGWLLWRGFSSPKIPRTPLDLPLLFLFGSWLFSTLFSVNPVYSRETLVFWVTYLFFFYLAADWGRWPWRVELTFNALLGVSGLVWMLALLQLSWWYRDYVPVPPLLQPHVEATLPRLSVLGNPNTMGSFLALVLPIALYKLVTVSKMITRLLLLLWNLMLIGALLLTQSRGGWLAFFVALGFFLIVSWVQRSGLEAGAAVSPWRRAGAALWLKWHPATWWGKGVVALIIIALGGSLTWLILSLRSFSEGLDIRQQVMAGALKTFWKYPLLGSGLGTLGEELIRNQQPLSRIWADAHNLYLTLVAETGLLGLLGLAWLIGLGSRFAWSTLRQPAPPQGGQASLVCLAALLGFAAHNLVDSLLKFPLIMLLVAILAGFWLGPYLRGEGVKAEWGRPVTVLALLLLATITSVGLNETRTIALYNGAVKAAGQGDWPASVVALREVNHLAPAMPFYERQLGFAAGYLSDQEPAFRQEAMAHYEAALSRLDQLGPDHANLSCLLATEGRWVEAVAAMGRALLLEPEQPLYRLNLGYYLELMGQEEAAQNEYIYLLSRYPQYIQSSYWRRTEERTRLQANIVKQVSQDQEISLSALIPLALNTQGAEAAQQLYEAYLRRAAVDPALAHLAQGQILLAQKQLAPAQAEFEAARELNPRLVEAYLSLSRVAGLEGRWEEAGQYAEAAFYLEPTPAARYQQALAAEANGQINLALAHYEAAFTELTTPSELELTRYATETARRRPFPASAYLPCLIRIYPTELLVEITRRQGKLLEQQGDDQAAGQVYQRLLEYEPGVEPIIARLEELCQKQSGGCGQSRGQSDN